LAEASGGRIPRIRKRALSLRREFLVELFERAVGEVDLTPDLEECRRVGDSQAPRDVADRAQVRRDVLSGPPVTPRCALHEYAILVREGHGDPVDLEFARIASDPRTESSLHAPGPRLELLLREHVVEREHRGPVRHGGEQRCRSEADRLRRAVGRDELRELRFELLELAHEFVILHVRDLDLIEDVVLVAVVVDLLPQLLDAYLRRRSPTLLLLPEAVSGCLPGHYDAISTRPATPIRSP
jgi:hypothetical protein